MSQQDHVFDKRLAERSVKRGLITQKDYEEYIQNLPDVSGKSQPLFPAEEDSAASTEDQRIG